MNHPTPPHPSPVRQPEISPLPKRQDNPPAGPPEIQPKNDPHEPDFSPPVEPMKREPEINPPGNTYNFNHPSYDNLRNTFEKTH